MFSITAGDKKFSLGYERFLHEARIPNIHAIGNPLVMLRSLNNKDSQLTKVSAATSGRLEGFYRGDWI